MTESYVELLARAKEFLTPPPEIPCDGTTPSQAIAAAALDAGAVPPAAVVVELTREELETRAAEFLAAPLPDPGPQIAADGLVYATAEPYLTNEVPPLPEPEPPVVDDGAQAPADVNGGQSGTG